MEELGISASTAQWLGSSYSLAMGIMVLMTAFLIRRCPSRQLFLGAMAIFAGGLLLDGVAMGFSMLVTGRILQAIGCGIIMSLSSGDHPNQVPGGKTRHADGRLRAVCVCCPGAGSHACRHHCGYGRMEGDILGQPGDCMQARNGQKNETG